MGSWRDSPGGWLGMDAFTGIGGGGGGGCVHEGLFLSTRGVPLRLWVTGSGRWRASKATGIDRTPHSRVGSALGLRYEPLNFGTTLKSEGLMGDAV